MRIGSEYRWILDGYTPETIPMTRLAEYMQQLGKLLGCEANVHFVRVEDNCVALVSKVDFRAAGNVSSRVASVRRGDGAADAMRAYETMNTMLTEDNGTARLRQGSATVISFPGAKQEAPDAVEVRDVGSIVGYLYMLSEAPRGFSARLRLNRQQTLICAVSAEMAKDLRNYLFETVKARGEGRWRRGAGGGWTPVAFTISNVVQADASSLRDVIREVRGLELDWPSDPLGYVSGMNGENGTIQ